MIRNHRDYLAFVLYRRRVQQKFDLQSEKAKTNSPVTVDYLDKVSKAILKYEQSSFKKISFYKDKIMKATLKCPCCEHIEQYHVMPTQQPFCDKCGCPMVLIKVKTNNSVAPAR